MRVIINGYESHPDNITNRKDIEFISCKEKECDIFITLDALQMNKPIKTVCRDGGLWCLPYEPPVECYRYFTDTYKYFDLINTQWKDISVDDSATIIHDRYHILPLIDQSMSEIKSFKLPSNTLKQNKVSAIISFANNLPGHKFRTKFVNFLKDMQFDFDHFGSGYNYIADKKDGLTSYKYSVAMENSSIPYYCTEKIGDCFACLTMPIYWGCPNITEYFPEESMIIVDENDFEGTLERIKEAVRDDHYSKYFDAIVYAKERLVEEHSIYPYICRLIDKYYKPTSEPKARLVPARIPPKQKKLSYKVKKALGIYKLKDKYRKRNWYKTNN